MIKLLAIAVGGAVGALGRYLLSTFIYQRLGQEFPTGTLVVNVLGSLMMGFLFVLFIERMTVSADLRALLLIGFLGSFTTFSTFSMETVTLLGQTEYLKAAMNVLFSVLLCLAATWLGMIVARVM